MLCQKETEIRAFVYSLQDPLLVNLYNQVEDLQKLGDTAQMPYTEFQIINFGVQLICKTHNFQDGLKQWFGKDTSRDDKTWENFKLHFEDEYDKLKQVRGATIHHAGFHQANIIMSLRVMEVVQSVHHSVLQFLHKFDDDDKENKAPLEPPVQLCREIRSTENVVQLEMLELIKSFQEDMHGLKNFPQSNNNNYNNCNYINNNYTKGGGRSQRTDKYCWSHGSCAHPGRNC